MCHFYVFKVSRGEANMAIGGYVMSKERIALFSPSVNYLQASIGFCYKENDAYIPLTRLTAPFTDYLWNTSGVILFISSMVILFSKRFNPIWRHVFIGGHLNRTPILNMWTAVLGNAIGNPRMTDRRNFGTFSRTITILWIFLWLIIRNAYQGALYTSLQDNRFSSPYDTINKIRESNCKILVPPPAYNLIKDMFNKDRYVF